MAVHAFTSFTFSYLPRARVLAETIRRQHPDWTIWAVLTDKEPDGFAVDWEKEKFDRLITFEMLFEDETDQWLFGHDLVEACTAVKGRALQYIMTDVTADKVFYFDPDIAVFNSMEPVVELLDKYSIVLTPHQIDPEQRSAKQAIRDNEITSLDYGAFNLGFIAVNNDVEGRRFASWWADRLHDWCHDRLDIGLFVDQKWCNLVPCFFDNVKVLRDPGYNVASWNLGQRNVKIGLDGEARVNGVLLRFYHFTKFGPVGASMTERYAGCDSDVFELWWWYGSQIEKYRDSQLPENWWFYGKFSDGTPISKRLRVHYREKEAFRIAFPKPYQARLGIMLSWLKTGR